MITFFAVDTGSSVERLTDNDIMEHFDLQNPGSFTRLDANLAELPTIPQNLVMKLA
jgi:hypothetical protein